MFAIAGIAFGKMLPPDKKAEILGIPNRLGIAAVDAASRVCVEVLLNAVGARPCDYDWRSAGAPWLILLFGYLTFFLVSFWVHDMESVRNKMVAVGAILSFGLVCILLFGVILG